MAPIIITPGSRVPPSSPEFPEPGFPSSLPTGEGTPELGNTRYAEPRNSELEPRCMACGWLECTAAEPGEPEYCTMCGSTGIEWR
jgi:hypothetical protein